MRAVVTTGDAANGREAHPAPAARLLRVIGSGERGGDDGPLAEAQFDHPQGMALAPAGTPEPGTPLAAGTLYVADAGNHTVRTVDLAAGEVATLAGTGRQARRFNVPGTGTDAALSSPWDVALVPDGGRSRLFEFGDEDGQGGHARLQHPYHVAVHAGIVFVADTYNNKIKRLEPATRRVETFLGSGEEGDDDGDAAAATFDEPQGLAVADDILYVADTNNHTLRPTDLRSSRPRVVTLTITG